MLSWQPKNRTYVLKHSLLASVVFHGALIVLLISLPTASIYFQKDEPTVVFFQTRPVMPPTSGQLAFKKGKASLGKKGQGRGKKAQRTAAPALQKVVQKKANQKPAVTVSSSDEYRVPSGKENKSKQKANAKSDAQKKQSQPEKAKRKKTVEKSEQITSAPFPKAPPAVAERPYAAQAPRNEPVPIQQSVEEEPVHEDASSLQAYEAGQSDMLELQDNDDVGMRLAPLDQEVLNHQLAATLKPLPGIDREIRVVVQVSVDKEGKTDSVVVAESSGVRAFDTMVKAGLLKMAWPVPLRSKTFKSIIRSHE